MSFVGKDAFDVRGIVHAQQLLTGGAWRFDPFDVCETRIIQRLQHRTQSGRRLGMSETRVVLQAGRMGIDANRGNHREPGPFALRYRRANVGTLNSSSWFDTSPRAENCG